MCFTPDPKHPKIIPEMEGFKVCREFPDHIQGLFYNQRGEAVLNPFARVSYESNIIEEINGRKVCFYKNLQDAKLFIRIIYEIIPNPIIVKIKAYNAQRGLDYWGAELAEIIDNAEKPE